MASAGTENRYSTFRRASTFEGAYMPNTNIPLRLSEKGEAVGITPTMAACEFAHWAATELRHEHTQYNSVADRLSALEARFLQQAGEMPKLQRKIQKLEGDEIPKLQGQLKEMPKLQEKIQKLEGDEIPKLQEKIQTLGEEKSRLAMSKAMQRLSYRLYTWEFMSAICQTGKLLLRGQPTIWPPNTLL